MNKPYTVSGIIGNHDEIKFECIVMGDTVTNALDGFKRIVIDSIIKQGVPYTVKSVTEQPLKKP